MKLIQEHIKTALAIFSVVSAIIGFIIGVYTTQKIFGNDIENIKEDMYLIKEWINTAR